MGSGLNSRKSVTPCHFYSFFGVFSMKNFAWVTGLLFVSAGAHTYPKSGQTPPPKKKKRKSNSISKYSSKSVKQAKA